MVNVLARVRVRMHLYMYAFMCVCVCVHDCVYPCACKYIRIQTCSEFAHVQPLASEKHADARFALPFFVFWTLLGTRWMSDVMQHSPTCVPSPEQLYFAMFWLVLCYGWIIVHCGVGGIAWLLELRVRHAERDLRVVFILRSLPLALKCRIESVMHSFDVGGISAGRYGEGRSSAEFGQQFGQPLPNLGQT